MEQPVIDEAVLKSEDRFTKLWCSYLKEGDFKPYLFDITTIKLTAKMKRMNKRKLKVAIKQHPKTIYTNCHPTLVPLFDKESNAVTIEFNFTEKTIS